MGYSVVGMDHPIGIDLPTYVPVSTLEPVSKKPQRPSSPAPTKKNPPKTKKKLLL